ncbi:MAG TPA: serine hydrolase domain-containing protein [Rhodocyclaceae bacterium]|nr:serine hydrolase domain-containing protein [Rhodocyclaceae bacterium]
MNALFELDIIVCEDALLHHALCFHFRHQSSFMVKQFLFFFLGCAFSIDSAFAQITGRALPGLESFDQTMSALLEKWNVPGASLAVAKNGRLVLAHAYGMADRDAGRLVQAGDPFRIGSISKTITAVAVLKLVEDGRLSLDDKVLPLLGDLAPPAKDIADPRVRDITVRELLQHTGGFDGLLVLGHESSRE